MQTERSYVIVGTGAAGISAVEAIRSLDQRGRITLIGDESEGYYSRPGLAYLLTGEVPEKQLFPFQQQDFERLKVDRVVGTVARLDPAARKVYQQQGAPLSYDRLLLATGAEARQVGVPGAQLQAVLKLDNIADARQIIRTARRARAGVVVGGGITALEIVEGLLARDVQVHYFLRRDRFWGSVLDETESRIIEHRLKEEGVQIHYHTELAEILAGTGGLLRRKTDRVGAVRTQDGREIACQLVAIAVGVVPRVELARSAGLEVDRGILVGADMRSSDPAIFAAGDVAQVFDPQAGRAVLDVLWPTARDQGRSAGLNMAGGRHEYRKETALNVTRLAGLTTTILGKVGSGLADPDVLGIVRGDSQTWREIPDAIASQNDFEVNRIRVMVGDRHLVGAVVMGDQTLSRPIQEMISTQVDIRPIRDKLLSADLPVNEVIADFWSGLKTRRPASP